MLWQRLGQTAVRRDWGRKTEGKEGQRGRGRSAGEEAPGETPGPKLSQHAGGKVRVMPETRSCQTTAQRPNWAHGLFM